MLSELHHLPQYSHGSEYGRRRAWNPKSSIETAASVQIADADVEFPRGFKGQTGDVRKGVDQLDCSMPRHFDNISMPRTREQAA